MAFTPAVRRLAAVLLTLCLGAPASAIPAEPDAAAAPKPWGVEIPVEDAGMPFEVVLHCPMGADGAHSIRIWRRFSSFAGCSVYYIQRDEYPLTRYREYNESPDDPLWQREGASALDWAELVCAGTDEKVFMITTAWNGRHVSPEALRYNSRHETWQELTLGVDGPPTYAVLNGDAFLLVGDSSPLDRGQGEEPYIAVRHVAGRGLSPEFPLRKLPSGKTFEVIALEPLLVLDTSVSPHPVPTNPGTCAHNTRSCRKCEAE